MNRFVPALATLWMAVACDAHQPDEYRYWTTSEGKRSSVQLKLLEQAESTVKLQRKDNGQVVTLQLERLSEADRAYVLARFRSTAPSNPNDHLHFRSDHGTSMESGLPAEWNSTKNIVWRTPLPGYGASTPIILGDRVYVTCYSGYGLDQNNPGEHDNLLRHLVCLSRDGGQIIWDKKVKAVRRTHDYAGFFALHGFASNTPVSDGKNVYCLFGNSGVYAFDAESGRELWNADVGRQLGGFGSSGSLVEHKQLVIVNASSESRSLIALRKDDGSEAWRIGDVEAAYGAPVLVPVDGRTEVVIDTKSKLIAADAETGEKLWTCLGSNPPRYICPTPIVVDGVIYATHGYNGPLTAVRPGGRGDVTDSPQRLWTLGRFSSTVTSPVHHQGLLFCVKDEGGVALCCDVKTGELLNQQRFGRNTGRIYASPLIADGRIYVVTRENGTYVLAADRTMTLIGHNTMEDDDSVFNASPIAHQGQLLLRSDRYLYCIGK